MSSEDPGRQDQPPSDDTAPYGQAPVGGANPYGTPAGGQNPYEPPAGPENPYGSSAGSDEPQRPPAGGDAPYGESTGAHGAYGEPPYGAPSYGQPTYQQPTYQQPAGYPPPQQWGQPQPGYPYGSGYAPPQNDGMALTAMIVGIVSLVLTCGYGIGLLGSPVALVLGRVSMKRIDRSGGRLAGRGMAQTGFILGIIGTVLLVLALIALVIVIVVAVNGGFDNNNDPSNFRYNS
jgi:hypothetical protein